MISCCEHPRKFKGIHGWFNYEEFYSWVVDKFPENSTFIEVGCWRGRSAMYMVESFMNKKKIHFYCVDTWESSAVEYLTPFVAQGQMGEGGNAELYNNDLFADFLHNMESVSHYFTPLRMPSLEASKLFSDQSVDFVFIDASHDYDDVKADIIAWLPKIKKGGIISGHDYNIHIYKEVCKAVDEIFEKKETLGDVWYFFIGLE